MGFSTITMLIIWHRDGVPVISVLTRIVSRSGELGEISSRIFRQSRIGLNRLLRLIMSRLRLTYVTGTSIRDSQSIRVLKSKEFLLRSGDTMIVLLAI